MSARAVDPTKLHVADAAPITETPSRGSLDGARKTGVRQPDSMSSRTRGTVSRRLRAIEW